MASQTTAPAGAQWFALHTLSGQENKVKTYIERFKTAEELDDSIFEVLLPTEVVSEVKNGKKSSKVRKLYPGYVFIQMKLFGEDGNLINKPWYFVREVAGVIGFVGEMAGELQKASWPTRTELRDSTIVVIAASFLLGLFTSISDFSLYQVVDLLTSLVSR